MNNLKTGQLPPSPPPPRTRWANLIKFDFWSSLLHRYTFSNKMTWTGVKLLVMVACAHFSAHFDVGLLKLSRIVVKSVF